MKTLQFGLLMLLLTPRFCFGETVGPSDLLGLSRSYINEMPACEFQYVIKTGLSERKITFRCQKEKFAFLEYSPEGDNLRQALTFDGERFYALYPGSRLVLSKNISSFESYYYSWFKYNPLFTCFASFFPKTNDGFGLPFLRETSSWSSFRSPQLVGTNKNLLNLVLDGEYGREYIQWSLESKYPSGGNSVVKGFHEMWKVSENGESSYKGKTFKYPSKIECIYTDPKGEASQYSYSISLVSGSFKIIEGDVAINEFRIPSSYVESVFDVDLNLHLKQPDWIGTINK